MRSWFSRLSPPPVRPPRPSARLGVAALESRVVPAQHVTVAGTEFDDVNANGIRDTGEAGLAGWTVFADLDNNGLLGPGEPSAVSDTNGNYRLLVDVSGQPTFRVMEQAEVGWAQSFDPAATPSQPTAAHPYYTLPFSDLNQRNIDFGNQHTNFVITSAGNLQTTETGMTASFTVVLTSQPTSDVTIPVNSSDPTEGIASTPLLTFTSADWDQAQTVTVTGQPDASVDGNVAYTIDLGPSSSLDPNYNNLPTQSVAVTNFDAAPVDKVGIFRALPRRWTLDAFNDGVYTAGRDARYTLLGPGQTIVGDWDGDGYDDIGLFRADTGTFSLFVNGNLFKTITRLDGRVGGVPLVGNWNGLPGDEVGLFRPALGKFVLDFDGDGVSSDPDDHVGAMLDGKPYGRPLVGNWDGVGGDEVGLYRVATGVFTLDVDGDLASRDPDDTVITRLAGKIGGQPLVGDWDGDGRADVGVFFGLTGQWLLDTDHSSTGVEITITKLDGAAGGRPVVGDFDGDGVTDCGLFRPLTGQWTVDLNHDGKYEAGVDLRYVSVDGAVGGVPIVGKWKLP